MDYEEIEIRKRIEEAKKMKYCAKQQMAQADIQIGEYDLQLLELDAKKEAEIEEEKPVTFRNYCDSIIHQAPIIVDIDKNNNLVTDTGKQLQCTIFELDKLQRLIRSDLSFKEIAKKMRWGETRARYMCCCIEYHWADEVFKIAKDKYNLNLQFDEYGQLIF